MTNPADNPPKRYWPTTVCYDAGRRNALRRSAAASIVSNRLAKQKRASGGAVAGLALALLAATWIVLTQIQRPLARLKSAMQALAADQLDDVVPFADRQDEIGQMARTIAAFQAALIEKRTLDGDARARSAQNLQKAAEALQAGKKEEAKSSGKGKGGQK